MADVTYAADVPVWRSASVIISHMNSGNSNAISMCHLGTDDVDASHLTFAVLFFTATADRDDCLPQLRIE